MTYFIFLICFSFLNRFYNIQFSILSYLESELYLNAMDSICQQFFRHFDISSS